MNTSGMIYRVRQGLGRYCTRGDIAANAGWLFFDKLLRMVVGLGIGIWLARYLGVAQFGLLSYAIAFASLFSSIASLGLDRVVVRDLVRDRHRNDVILGSAFALKLAGGCAALLLAVTAVSLLQPGDTTTRRLVAIIAAGMLFQATDIFDFWFQSQVRSKYTVFAKTSAFLILSAVKVVLILAGADLVAFAWAALAEIVTGAVGLVVAYTALGNSIARLKPSRRVIGVLLGESWPLLFSGLAIMLYMRIDQVMLGRMAGEHEVGLYSAALRLSESWYIIPAVIVRSIMPAITTARSTSSDDYYRLLQQSFNLLVRAAYLVAIPMTILATPLVSLLYGADFRDAGPVLAIHIWSALFVFLGAAQGPWMVNEGLTRISLLFTTAGAVLNIALNYQLIPYYGASGCAVATILSYGLTAWLANLLLDRTRPIFHMQSRAIFLGIVK